LAELVLERLDLAADRRLGHEQLLRRTREAQMARGAFEISHGFQGWQAHGVTSPMESAAVIWTNRTSEKRSFVSPAMQA